MIKLYKILSYIIIIDLILLTIFLVDSGFESYNIDKSIDEFKSRGKLVYTEDNYSYYNVSKKYQYEDCANICESPLDINVGTTGDIYISNRDPLGDFLITEWISKIAWIGHAGVVYNEEGTQMIEVVGNKSKKDNVVKIYDNKWLTIDSPEYIVMRVKGINEKDKEIIKKNCDSILGCQYNYNFLFSSDKKFYCTDIASYIYKKINIDLNKDNFFTTGSDIINNENTYIIYYKEKYIKNNKICYNIYYLDEE